MAPSKEGQPSTKDSKASKLPKLPNNARIEKRPLLHPPIRSPYTGADQPKVIYISTKTPFISAVKRVRALLAQIEKRSTPKVGLVNGRGSDKWKLNALAQRDVPPNAKEPEAVTIKGANKAIMKTCELALFFQNQDDCKVVIKTGTVGTVDDIVEEDKKGEAEAAEEDDEDLPGSRIRWLSVVEAHISLK